MMKTLAQYRQGELVCYYTEGAWWPVRVREYKKTKNRLVVVYLYSDKAPM